MRNTDARSADADSANQEPPRYKSLSPIRQHVDALRTAAAAAVARAFATALPREAKRAGAPTKPVRQRVKAAPRRAPEELVALGERFYAVLCRPPGETMTTLAPQVGVAPRVLQIDRG